MRPIAPSFDSRVEGVEGVTGVFSSMSKGVAVEK